LLRLHQFHISPYCDKIRRALRWKGQVFEVVEVPLAQAPALRKMNPAGKLPILEHDGELIPDSTDIARHLEEHFPEPPLYPSDPKLRGLCHVLEDWADESLYFYEMALRFTFPHNAERFVPKLVEHDGILIQSLAPHVIPRMMRTQTRRQGVGRRSDAQIVSDVARHLDAVDGLLEGGDWLVGDALSIADLSVFAELACIRGTDEGGKLVEGRPRVGTWMDRVDAATAPAG